MKDEGINAPDVVMAAGAAAMLVLGLALDWTSFEGYSADNAFDYFFGALAWIVIVGVGIVAVLHATRRLPSGPPWALIMLVASLTGTALMVLQLVLGAKEVSGISLDRGIGMWLAGVWALVTTVGAAMSFRADSATSEP